MAFCLSCGHNNPNQANFCMKCGTSLQQNAGFQSGTICYSEVSVHSSGSHGIERVICPNCNNELMINVPYGKKLSEIGTSRREIFFTPASQRQICPSCGDNLK